MSQVGPVGGGLAALLSLGQAKNWDCEDVFKETALAVDGVVSAEFDCSDRSEDGSIVVGALAAGFLGVPTIRELHDHYGKDWLSDAT